VPANRLNEILLQAGLPTGAEDCAVVSLNPTENLVTNIDVFTPIHDDPYILGKIAACNVTNDLFAMNATEVLTYSSFLALPVDLPEDYPAQMVRGQNDFLHQLGAKIDGGHTIMNPWPLIGGSASAVIKKELMIRKTGVQAGDHLILTKPMGIQPIMAAYRLRYSNPEYLEELEMKRIENAIDLAVKMMTTSNQAVAKTISLEHFRPHIHALTDVTGFGFRIHLTEMLGDSHLIPQISHLPVIPTSPDLADILGYRLKQGYAAETAGAMLLAIDEKFAEALQNALKQAGVWSMDVGMLHSPADGKPVQEEYDVVEVTDYTAQ
jgi:selenide,water dikinase